ncbi:MAG TPA: hypothetical protein VMT04_05915 [Terriglobales bacterium]|nr:hypothetical protein [Terriglobales bacterium]
MRKIVFFLLLGFILVYLTSIASARDGRRRGGILGFGIGTGITSFTHKAKNVCSGSW